MKDEFVEQFEAADPAARLSSSSGQMAREVMRASTGARLRPNKLRLTLLTTVALLALGGGAAVAAPTISNVFFSEPTVLRVHLISEGSQTVRCSSTMETSIKLGEVERHRATVERWQAFARQHQRTVHVNRTATRIEIMRAISVAGFDLQRQFDRTDPGENLADAADISVTVHCKNLPAR